MSEDKALERTNDFVDKHGEIRRRPHDASRRGGYKGSPQGGEEGSMGRVRNNSSIGRRSDPGRPGGYYDRVAAKEMARKDVERGLSDYDAEKSEEVVGIQAVRGEGFMSVGKSQLAKPEDLKQRVFEPNQEDEGITKEERKYLQRRSSSNGSSSNGEPVKPPETTYGRRGRWGRPRVRARNPWGN